MGFNRDLKLSQPLRTVKDRSALREAALNGTLDVVVSDHRPRTPEEHDADFMVVAPGIAGLHAVGPVLWGALKDHGASDEDAASAMSRLLSTGPRRVLGKERTLEDSIESATLFSPTNGALNSSSKAPNTVYSESTEGISGRVVGVLTSRGAHWN